MSGKSKIAIGVSGACLVYLIARAIERESSTELKSSDELGNDVEELLKKLGFDVEKIKSRIREVVIQKVFNLDVVLTVVMVGALIYAVSE